MKDHAKLIAGIVLAAISCSVACYILFSLGYIPWLSQNHRSRNPSSLSENASTEPAEEWFTEEAVDEDFDFGLDEDWIDLNDLEYTLTDNLKNYLYFSEFFVNNQMIDFLILNIEIIYNELLLFENNDINGEKYNLL